MYSWFIDKVRTFKPRKKCVFCVKCVHFSFETKITGLQLIIANIYYLKIKIQSIFEPFEFFI